MNNKGSREVNHKGAIKNWPWKRLRWQLILGFVPLILIPVLVTQVVARGITEEGLKILVTQRAQRRALDLAQVAADYYGTHGSWEGVAQVILVPPWLPLVRQNGIEVPTANSDGSDFVRVASPEQVMIADTQGQLIASDGLAPIGIKLAPAVLQRGAPIQVRGITVGTLVIGEALGILNQQQQQVLGALNSGLIASGAASAALAFALGLYLSWQVTRPARQLTQGLKQLAEGTWNTPLEVKSSNEFGDLTRAFNHMATELTRQEKLRRQMVADVAHDLRTPLTAMMLEVDAIEAGLQPVETAAVHLREEIHWLQHLVEDLRLLSLIDSDQLTITKRPVDISAFLRGLHDFFQPAAQDRERVFTLDVREPLPCVCVDLNRIRQVIGNLFDNALRHTAPHGHIVLHARADQDTLCIEISDDGEGIPAQDLPHIFERFYRVDRSRTLNLHADDGQGTLYSGGHGSGLGLSIAQKIVELHQGTLTVASQFGHGSTFTIRIPIES
jgi:two-component system OmpR family sensor kinase/two-component system sensor histidine kinase BaeS